jgi:hypothetical protein
MVLDSNDAPIADADVAKVGERQRQVKSSGHGVFRVGMTRSPWNPEPTWRVEKPGFKFFEKRFHAKEHLESIVVTLEPVDHSPDSGVRKRGAREPPSVTNMSDERTFTCH